MFTLLLCKAGINFHGGEFKLKIAVFSDSHGRTDDMMSVIENVHPNHIIHLGDYIKDAYEISYTFPDINLSYVAGNNDYFYNEPFLKTEIIGNKRFFLVHGHQYCSGCSVSVPSLSLDARRQFNADVALFGHTHVPFYGNEHGVYVMNPGSISLPRSSEKSYGIIEIKDGVISARICPLR